MHPFLDSLTAIVLATSGLFVMLMYRRGHNATAVPMSTCLFWLAMGYAFHAADKIDPHRFHYLVMSGLIALGVSIIGGALVYLHVRRHHEL